MNITNLQLVRNHTAKIVENKLKMSYFRVEESPDAKTPICKSVGCIIGHATSLDAENVKDNFTNEYGIKFPQWSEDFLGIYADSALWTYLFGYQHLDIKDYHLYRMDYILAGNETPEQVHTFVCEHENGIIEYARYYDDGYFIPKGMKI